MESKEIAIGDEKMKNHILIKLVALEEDVSKQYFRSFSWLLLDAFDKKKKDDLKKNWSVWREGKRETENPETWGFL